MNNVKDFLSLAITETQPNTGKFNVIAMETRSQNIIPFNLVKEQIVSKKGEISWDIGFITSVYGNITEYKSNYNITYLIDGETKLGENKINSIRNILEAKSINPANFFENEKQRYSIIKINKVHDLYIKKDADNIKHYLSVYIMGTPAYKNPLPLLIKDYRWINFWNWVCKEDIFIEKRKKYINLFNRKDKSLYLILYRHYYENKSLFWIAGMHWL